MALCTVSGNVKRLLGLPPAMAFNSGTVRFMLTLPPRTNVTPTVTGTGLIVTYQTDFSLANDGSFSGQIQGNDGITPPNTLYAIMFLIPNISVAPMFFNITGTSLILVPGGAVPNPALTDALVAGSSFSDAEVPNGLINGSNQVYGLNFSPLSQASLLLFRNGILQTGGGVDYVLVNSTITMVSAPLTGDSLIAWYRH